MKRCRFIGTSTAAGMAACLNLRVAELRQKVEKIKGGKIATSCITIEDPEGGKWVLTISRDLNPTQFHFHPVLHLDEETAIKKGIKTDQQSLLEYVNMRYEAMRGRMEEELNKWSMENGATGIEVRHWNGRRVL